MFYSFYKNKQTKKKAMQSQSSFALGYFPKTWLQSIACKYAVQMEYPLDLNSCSGTDPDCFFPMSFFKGRLLTYQLVKLADVLGWRLKSPPENGPLFLTPILQRFLVDCLLVVFVFAIFWDLCQLLFIYSKGLGIRNALLNLRVIFTAEISCCYSWLQLTVILLTMMPCINSQVSGIVILMLKQNLIQTVPVWLHWCWFCRFSWCVWCVPGECVTIQFFKALLSLHNSCPCFFKQIPWRNCSTGKVNEKVRV